jgi:hypothetical protein
MLRLAALCLSIVTIAGCGNDGPERFQLAGRVTFRGQPVPAGTIIFEPDISKGNDGPQGVATITDGSFDTALGGRGTIGGPHHITILGCDGVNVTETSPQGKPLFAPHVTSADVPKRRAELNFAVP